MRFDPELPPKSEADVARMIEKQTDFIEQVRLKEIPNCIDGLCEEIE